MVYLKIREQETRAIKTSVRGKNAVLKCESMNYGPKLPVERNKKRILKIMLIFKRVFSNNNARVWQI